MGYDNSGAGYDFVPAYQTSGLPWITSSVATTGSLPVRFDFPFITKMVKIYNRGTAGNLLSIGFSSAGVSGSIVSRKFFVDGGQTQEFDCRVNMVFIQGESATPNYSLYAALTKIPAREMPFLLTGSMNV